MKNIQEFINQLPAWDGQDHIGLLSHTLKSNAMIGATKAEQLRTWLKKAFLQATEQQFNDKILVLYGTQGCGKSTWLNKLFPFDELIFTGHLPKENTALFSEYMLLNVEDQIDIMNTNLMQSFLSNQENRIASMVASVNVHDPDDVEITHPNVEDLLLFSVNAIDFDVNIDYLQVWAQVRAISQGI